MLAVENSLNSNKVLEDLKKEHRNIENQFPIEIYPKIIQEYIHGIGDTLSLSKEYLSCSILVALSTAFGNLYRIKIKEGFYQKTNMWLVIVGRPGDGKSPCIDFAMKPLEDYEKNLYEDYQHKLKEWNSVTDNSDPKPILKNFLLKDFTFEALSKAHSNNSHGLCICTDEILSWINSFGKYSNSSEENNYLTIWNGGAFKISRKTTGDLRIGDSFVNVIGGLQNGRINQLTKDKDTSGFNDRLLFCIPEYSPIRLLNKNVLESRLLNNYNVLFERIFEKYQGDYLVELSYSEAAFDKIVEWQNQLAFKYDNEDDILFSLSKKLELYVHRFSLLIELVNGFSDDRNIREVSLNSVENAILLMNYFEKNACKVRESIDDPLDGIGINQKKLYHNLPNSFKTKHATDLADKLEISKKTIERALKNKNLYIKDKHGSYSKK